MTNPYANTDDFQFETSAEQLEKEIATLSEEVAAAVSGCDYARAAALSQRLDKLKTLLACVAAKEK